jgi:hypothetical protein
VLSGRGLCDGLITRPEESYRLWRVVVCDQETSNTRRLNPLLGCENTTTVGCNARKTTTYNSIQRGFNLRNDADFYVLSLAAIFNFSKALFLLLSLDLTCSQVHVVII